MWKQLTQFSHAIFTSYLSFHSWPHRCCRWENLPPFLHDLCCYQHWPHLRLPCTLGMGWWLAVRQILLRFRRFLHRAYVRWNCSPGGSYHLGTTPWKVREHGCNLRDVKSNQCHPRYLLLVVGMDRFQLWINFCCYWRYVSMFSVFLEVWGLK